MDAVCLVTGTEDANVSFGVVTDENMGENVRVTVIAAGFEEVQQQKQTSVERRSERAFLQRKIKRNSWSNLH